MAKTHWPQARPNSGVLCPKHCWRPHPKGREDTALPCSGLRCLPRPVVAPAPTWALLKHSRMYICSVDTCRTQSPNCSSAWPSHVHCSRRGFVHSQPSWLWPARDSVSARDGDQPCRALPAHHLWLSCPGGSGHTPGLSTHSAGRSQQTQPGGSSAPLGKTSQGYPCNRAGTQASSAGTGPAPSPPAHLPPRLFPAPGHGGAREAQVRIQDSLAASGLLTPPSLSPRPGLCPAPAAAYPAPAAGRGRTAAGAPPTRPSCSACLGESGWGSTARSAPRCLLPAKTALASGAGPPGSACHGHQLQSGLGPSPVAISHPPADSHSSEPGLTPRHTGLAAHSSPLPVPSRECASAHRQHPRALHAP